MPGDSRSPKGIMTPRISPPFSNRGSRKCHVNVAGMRQMPIVLIRLRAYDYREAHTSGDSIPRNCSQLSSLSPAAKCQHDDGPCHQECSKTHADGEDKHGHQTEILHIPDDVPRLQKIELAKYHIGEDNKPTYAGHEDETTGDKAERRYKFGWRSRGEDRGWWRKEGQNIGYSSGECKADKESAPLLVDHC